MGEITDMTDRATNREQMPITARRVDQVRAEFGDGVRVTYACEGGAERGGRGPDTTAISDAQLRELIAMRRPVYGRET